MSEEQKKYYLYIDRQAVPVSEQVYWTYHHYGRKEEYFTYDLKTEKFSCDQEAQTAAFTPAGRIPMSGCWRQSSSSPLPAHPRRKKQSRLSGWRI